jgi:uncharacterized membrane protein YhaH (DUF805 family)
MLQNFIGFEGRIGRQSWWIGFIILLIVYLVLSFILSAVVGASMFSMMSNPDAMMQPGAMEAIMQKSAWVGLILLAVILYPGLSLTGKRLNDRDRPSWLKWLLFAPAILGALANVAGLGYTTADVSGVAIPTPSTIGYILSLLALVALIWWIVECGFLRGTDGPNRFGPDPIAA